MSSYSHILKYTGIFGSVQVLYVLIAVVRNKLAALLIGTVGMGLADLYGRTVELVGNTTNFGIGFSGVRRLSALYETGDRRTIAHYVRLIRSWVLLTALLGALVCLACSPLLSYATTGSYDVTLEYCLLAPAVAFTTLTGGELAVLKGIRQLKRMAAVSALAALASLFISAALYWWFGLRGVLPVFVLIPATTFVLNLRAASHEYPYRVTLRRPRFLRQGSEMLRLGVAYIVAGICGTGAEFAVRSFLSRSDGGLDAVGLYAAGFVLTVSYARIIFTAMDADYFPRLSAAVGNRERMNTEINRQTDVLVLLIAPFLIAFAVALPLIVRVLYTEAFLQIIPMVICAAGYMFFKACFSPAAYLPLAAGHSFTYMTMELAYDIPFIFLVVGGYELGGLAGAGIGLTISNGYNFLLVLLVYMRRYGYRPAARTVRLALVQGLLLAAGLAAAWQTDALLHYGLGLAVLLASAALTWRKLGSELSLNAIRQRFKQKRE